MSCEASQVPLSSNDLRAMGAIVTAHGTSLRHGVPPSPKRERVKTWLCEHHQFVQQHARTGQAGVRMIPCWLPIKSPWLNCIEPHWARSKRAIVEPARLLTASELKQRVCDSFDGEVLESLRQQVS